MNFLKEWLNNKNVAVAFASGLLFVAVVAAYYYGDNIYIDSSNQTNVTAAWGVILVATSVVLSALFALGIPYLYGKDAGFKKFLKVVFLEAIMVAIALVISGFFFFPSMDDCTSNPNSSSCSGSGSDNVDFQTN